MLERKPNPSDSPSRFLILPLWLIAIYAIGTLFTENSTIFLWIICAFFVFVILDPTAEYLKKHRWPVVVSSAVLALTATLVTFLVAFTLGKFVSGMVLELEQSKKIFMHTFESLNSTWNTWVSNLSALNPTAAGPNQVVSKVEIVQGSPLGSDMGGTILHGVGSAVTVATFAILVPILTFFFLAERDGFARGMALAYFDKCRGRETWAAIVSATRAYFVGNLILSAITYPVFAIMFFLFKVPSVFTVSALATAFNLVPFAGAVLSGFLPSLTLYAATQSAGTSVALYGCCIVIHFAVADFITPKILGSRVNINATTSTIALVAWGELWGGLGLLLAIPITASIKILFEKSDFFWLQWIAELMSETKELKLNLPILARGEKVEKY